jgi:tRNA1Val (adenine37-N6)-methyltransferase
MLAQKIRARIDAVEIDQHSFERALGNVAESPFFQQIHVFNSDYKNWVAEHKYEVIISNPPFYENDLLSEDDGRNLSKHSGALSLESLIVQSKNLLCEAGFLAVLLPGHRADYFENIASQHSLFVEQKALIRQTPSHSYFRAILLLRQARTLTQQSIMEIRNDANGYSAEFIRLLKEYYLHL